MCSKHSHTYINENARKRSNDKSRIEKRNFHFSFYSAMILERFTKSAYDSWHSIVLKQKIKHSFPCSITLVIENVSS